MRPADQAGPTTRFLTEDPAASQTPELGRLNNGGVSDAGEGKGRPEARDPTAAKTIFREAGLSMPKTKTNSAECIWKGGELL